MSDELIEKWRGEAAQVTDPMDSASVPVPTLFGEAVDLVGFVRRYWAPELDGTGRVLRPGLSQVNSAQDVRLPPSIAEEIDELQQASSRAHTLYLLASGGPTENLMGRATSVLADLSATLEFLFDDGQDTLEDLQLTRIKDANAEPSSQDKMALALEQYADLADEHRVALDALGTFDIGVIDLARELATELRQRSAPKAAENEAANARLLRNQLWTLLQDRVRRVRSVARYVFRLHPDVARQATSSYQRRQRAETRRRAQNPPQDVAS